MDMISKQRAIDRIRDVQAQITCSFSEMWLNGMNEGFDHAVSVIELMKTVDAIPVKWLKDNFPTSGVYGTESYFRKAHAVEDILKDWELEKEKRKKE